MISTVSNAIGEADFNISGGGCVVSALTGEDTRYNGGNIEPVRVTADGQLLGEVGVNSPDVVNTDGLLPTDTIEATRPDGQDNCSVQNNLGSTEVGLADAVFHTVPFSLGTVEKCSNFTGPDFDDPVGLPDAVVATPYIKSGTSCACGP